MKRDDSAYLRHILDAIKQVELYIDGFDEDAFMRNRLVQDGVIRQIEIIGEATRYLSPKLRKIYPHVPWADIGGMRNKLIHNYFGVDIATVWLTAIEDLPLLKQEIEKILSTL